MCPDLTRALGESRIDDRRHAASHLRLASTAKQQHRGTARGFRELLRRLRPEPTAAPVRPVDNLVLRPASH